MHTYQFDGIRADTVPEVSMSFWREYQEAVGNTYMVGEVYNGKYVLRASVCYCDVIIIECECPCGIFASVLIV